MKILKATLGTALVGMLASPALGAFTCETVARSGQLDGNGNTFSRLFHTAVAVNTSGDTLFSARPDGGRDNLYVFSGDGSSKVILASGGSPAPGGLVYKTGKTFTELGMNNFDDVVFKARIVGGEAIFGRFGATAVKKIAAPADASPCGDAFSSFPAVSSRISNAGNANFVAIAGDGTSAAVAANLDTGALGCVFDEGDVVDGREICAIVDVGRGDTGIVAIRAITKADCTDGLETPLDAIITDDGGGEVVALEGDSSPIAGTTYTGFALEPSIVGSDIAFLASVTGSVNIDAIFVDSPPTAVAIAENQAAPDVGGAFRTFNDFTLTNPGVFTNAKLVGTTAKNGILSSSEAAVVKSDEPPTDAFGVGSKYTTLQKKSAMSLNGEILAVMVKVKDTNAPSKKAGIIRCED